MIAVDTNILVRYIVQLDEPYTKVADHFFDTSIAQHRSIFISLLVLCEVVWVLGRSYGFSRKQLVTIVEMLKTSEHIILENPDIVTLALEDFRSKKAGFSDYIMLHIAERHRALPLYTFDQALADHPMAVLLVK